MSLEARLAALEQQYALLQKQHALLQARNDIWHGMTRYARGIDEQRQEDLDAIFTDDVELVTFPWSQHAGVGKDAALDAFRTYQRTFHHPRRFITNEQIQVHDDGTATGWKIRKMCLTVECMTTLERGWGMMEERVLPLPPRPMN